KADKVVIGQKGAIDTLFTVLWKKKALKNLYDDNAAAVRTAFDLADEDIDKILANSAVDVTLGNKTKIEKAFAAAEAKFSAKPDLLPAQFKQFDWDLNVAEMADYVFKNSQGQTVRW